MAWLTVRRSGDEIYIGDGIRLTVLENGGRLMRLAIEAPGHVPIRNGEDVPAGDPRRLFHDPDGRADRCRPSA